MPAHSYNMFSPPIDGIVFLIITSELPDDKADGINIPYPAESVKLLVDEKHWLKLLDHKWYWDRKHKKCFGYITDYSTGEAVNRGKMYLNRYLFELELKHTAIGKVFMADCTDFRISQMLHRPVAARDFLIATKPI